MQTSTGSRKGFPSIECPTDRDEGSGRTDGGLPLVSRLDALSVGAGDGAKSGDARITLASSASPFRLARGEPLRPPTTSLAVVSAVVESLPDGIVTFLFTDVEGSPRLWEEAPDSMIEALRHHDELISDSVEMHGGISVKPRCEGDSRFVVFGSAVDATNAVAEIQRRDRY